MSAFINDSETVFCITYFSTFSVLCPVLKLLWIQRREYTNFSTMGFETTRFTSADIDKDLMCSICMCVLEKPVEVSDTLIGLLYSQ